MLLGEAVSAQYNHAELQHCIELRLRYNGSAGLTTHFMDHHDV